MSLHNEGDRWIVRWRGGGRNRSRTFKRSDGFRKEDAQRFEHSIKRQKRLGGVDPLANEREFVQCVEEWWRSHHGSVSEMTRVNQRGYMENVILPRFEGMRLCDLTTPVLEDFRMDLETEGVGAPTQRKILFVLSGVFTYAMRMGYLTYNPMQAVRKPAAYRHRLIQPFPPERVEKLRDWFLDRNDLESATMVSVLAYSGPRPAEAYELLTWADLGQTTIIYRGEKTERDRQTRLLPPLAQDLARWRGEGPRQIGPVFGWSESRFNNWRRRRFQKATENLGIENTRPYDLRHAFASLLAAEGRDTSYIARQMGNSIATCERWYRHLIEDVDEPTPAEDRIYAARKQTRLKEVANG